MNDPTVAPAGSTDPAGPTDSAGRLGAWLDSLDVDHLDPELRARVEELRSGESTDAIDALTAMVSDLLDRSHDTATWDLSVQQDEALFDKALVPLFVVDHQGFITRSNDRTNELVGLTRDEVIGEHVGRFIHPEDYDSQADHWVRMLVDTTFDAVSSEIRILTTHGVSWQRVALKASREPDGTLTGITAHLSDINEKYAAVAALDRSQRQFGNLLDSIPDPIVRLNRRLEVEFANPAAQRLRRNLPGSEWPAIGEMDHGLMQGALQEVLDTGRSQTIEHSVGAEPRLGWCETTIVPEPHADGTIRSLLLICRDVTGRRRNEADLAHQATHDTLTGLPNRGRFAELLDVAIGRQRVHEHAGSPRSIAVLFLDLDRFKVVNDSLGHAAGDELLVQVARRLQQALRPGDVLGRLGGDEFTVLADDISAEHAMALAERLRLQLGTPFELGGGEFLMSASVGVATSSTPERPEDLMRWADAAMYRAKQGGRDCVVAFDDVLRNEALEQLETDQLLRVALDRDELEVRYQPEVALSTGAVVGAEALVRWRHPTRGLLTAEAFVPLAEENGTIVAIDQWVMATACERLAGWIASGMVPEDFVLRVNVSARQFEHHDLVGRVRSLLERSGVAPERLCLEITETALMRDVERALEVLTDLHDAGIRLAVDDFGTGYSSLSSLKRFPLQVLKIDRSFIDGLPDDPDDTAIATTVLRLADALGLAATAEGVETTDQLECLRELGCPTAQGHLFAEPLERAEFDRYLAEHC